MNYKFFVIISMLGLSQLSWADDIQTKDGKTYKDVQVVEITSTGVSFLCNGRAEWVDFSNMQPQIASRYGYNPNRDLELAQIQKKVAQEKALLLQQQLNSQANLSDYSVPAGDVSQDNSSSSDFSSESSVQIQDTTFLNEEYSVPLLVDNTTYYSSFYSPYYTSYPWYYSSLGFSYRNDGWGFYYYDGYRPYNPYPYNPHHPHHPHNPNHPYRPGSYSNHGVGFSYPSSHDNFMNRPGMKPIRLSPPPSARTPFVPSGKSSQVRPNPANRSTPNVRSNPANRSTPNVRSNPANRSTPNVRSNPANRSTPNVRSNPANRSTPNIRSNPVNRSSSSLNSRPISGNRSNTGSRPASNVNRSSMGGRGSR